MLRRSPETVSQRVAPPRDFGEEDDGPRTAPDQVVFDKARKAESVENLRESRSRLEQELAKFDTMVKEADDEKVKSAAEKEKQKVQNKIERLDRLIANAESKISED